MPPTRPFSIQKLIIEGAPPKWTPAKIPRKLKEDSGDFFKDQNGARYPKHPTEPAVQAVLTMQSEFKPSTINIFACGSTMRNLLRFASGMDQSFFFDVEIIGDTAFFVRKENSPTELIQNIHGFGHTFPEENTTWDNEVKGSASHQRIIGYNFGDHRCLIRSKSDGYLPNKAEDDHGSKSCNNRSDHENDGMDSLLTAASSVNVTKSVTYPGNSIRVQQGGRMVPQKAVLDIKTRSFRRPIDMDEVLPHVWVNQTPNFVIGYHKSGLFDDVKIKDLQDQISQWEEDHQPDLQRLNAIIHRVVETAKEMEGKKLDINRAGTGPLELRMPLDSSTSTLPPELEARWVGLEANTIVRPASSCGEAQNLEDEEEDSGNEYDESGFGRRDLAFGEDGEDSDESLDYTACSASACGYCGRCRY
jgi:hypothetical protein